MSWTQIKALLVKANPHELVYFAVGYYAGVHYSKQVMNIVIYILSGATAP